MRIFLVLMLLWAAAVNAEEKQQIIELECYPIKPFLERFKEYYGEKLVFMSESANGLGEPLFHQMWLNPATQTWTFMVSNKPREMICIISSGKGFVDFSDLGI